MTGVEIRPLAEADWSQVHEIVVEVAASGDTYAMEIPADVEATQRAWSAPYVVVAVEGDKILGAAQAGPNREAQGAHVGTASFVVAAAAWGHGVGRALGEHVVRWHREQGFRAIQFNAVVSTNVAAIWLWRSLGFEVVGRVPRAFCLPSGEYADLLVMHLDLTRDEPTAEPLTVHGDEDRVLVVASRHFTERGWGGTTIAGIAVEAGVSEALVHRHHGSKADLLMAAFRWVAFGAGGDLRQAFAALGLPDIDDVDERLRLVGDFAAATMGPMLPMIPTLNEAAAVDPTGSAVKAGADLRRLDVARALVGLLSRGGPVPPQAVLVVHVLSSAETYLGFVRLGWSPERYAAWLAGALDWAINGVDAAGAASRVGR